ncbi:MAG: thioesterase family protein [Pseudomonadota bacterium]
MMDSFDGKPIRTSTQQVPAEWIDYNGHMNVAYYLMAIDRALDEAFDTLGIGVSLVKSHRMGPMALSNTIHYLDELLEGQHYYCEFQVLDADHKRIHLFVNMFHVEKGSIAATYESLSMNVDLDARKSAAYPEGAYAQVMSLKEAHARLPRPSQVGEPIGIRRRG